MDLTGQEAKQLAAAARARSGLLRRLSDKQLAPLIHGVIAEVGATLKGIEHRLTEAGSMPGDIAGVLMLYGAVVAIIEDMPANTDRPELVAAGREVGVVMRKKYADKIGDELSKKTGEN